MLTRRNLILAGGAVLLLLVLVFIFRGEGKRAPGKDGEPSSGRSSLRDFFGFGSGDDIRDGEPLSPKKVLFSSAQEYRLRAKWPPYSMPITEKNDPIKEDFEPSQNTANPAEHPEGPYLVQYVTQNSYSPNDLLVVHAFLLDTDKKKVQTDGLSAVLTLGGANGRQVARMDMRDDGQPGDERGDLIYTAGFRLPPDLARDTRPANYIVVIKAQTKNGEITATNAFNVGSLNIRHTGKFSDSIVSDEKGKHLSVEAEFQVEKEGFYHVQATLYSENGEGIGWAQNRIKLTPGVQIVQLKFYGNLFCGSRTDGPYVMRHFAYANVNAMPGPRSDNFKNLHKTQSYKASDFTCAAFEDAELLAKAKLLEQEAAEEKQ